MSRQAISQVNDVSPSQEVPPPGFPAQLYPLLWLDELYNFRFQGRDIYEDVLKAFSEGREYKDWAWWPWLIFPIPEEVYEHKQDTGELVHGKSLAPMIELLSNEKWGKRLGYAVKLLHKMGSSGIVKIIEGVPGKRAQNTREFWLRRFLLTVHCAMTVPDLEEDEDAKQLCLQVVNASWVGYIDELDEVRDIWGLEELLHGEPRPLDFEEFEGRERRIGSGSPSYFTQGMTLADAGMPLKDNNCPDNGHHGNDRPDSAQSNKNYPIKQPRQSHDTRSTNHDIRGHPQVAIGRGLLLKIDGNGPGVVSSGRTERPERWPSIRSPQDGSRQSGQGGQASSSRWYEANVSSSRQHQPHGQLTSTREYRYGPSSSASTRRQTAPPPDVDMPDFLKDHIDRYRERTGYAPAKVYRYTR